MFKLAKKLHAAGVLGINSRNGEYTLKYNDRKYYPLADDKLKTALLAKEMNIPIPEIYTVIDSVGEIHQLHDRVKQHKEFVVKPARGSGGDGIIVVTDRKGDDYIRIGGKVLSQEDLTYHCANILSGMFSLGGVDDKVIIQYRVNFDHCFKDIAFQGVPDIRIIVFLGVPTMAMIRLPTKQSDGKANLHQGAIAAGINMSTGKTLKGVWQNKIISQHPDTGVELAGRLMPHWSTLLHMSARCFELTKLGYIGVDIVLDENRGPLILELNARPGLNIQIANQSGLRERLELIQKHANQLSTVENRIQFCQTYFNDRIQFSESQVN